MDTNINFTNDLNGESDVKTSFNLPRKIYNLTAGRAVADGAIVVESESCTYETMLNIDRTRLLNEASLLLLPNTYKEGKLYSHKPLNGNGDFTATRATTATRVNSAGLVDLVPYNLVGYSEMFTDASWTKTRASITPNTTSAPNGTLTADSLIENNTTSTHSLSVAVNVVDSSYTVSVYAKANQRNWINITWLSTANASAFFNISNGTLGTIGSAATATITSVGNGWYRCTMTATLAAGSNTLAYYLASADNTLTYTGDSVSGFFIWGAQLAQGTSARDYLRTETRLNIPRIDYSLGGCPNILLEPQRTNLALQSSSFDSATWTKLNGSSVSLTSGVTNPSGGSSSFKYIASNLAFGGILRQALLVTSGIAYTFSFFAKKDNYRYVGIRFNTSLNGQRFPNYDFDTDTLNTQGVAGATLSRELWPNGWVRLILTFTTTTTNGNPDIAITTANGDTSTALSGGQSVFIWGAQLEAGAYATSFIPTTTASVTRNADSITRNNIYTNGLITAAGGTWFVELRNNVSRTRDAGSTAFGIGNNAALTDNSLLFISPSSGRITFRKTIGGTATSLFSTTTDVVKLAVKWNGSTADVFVNGVKQVSATAFAITNMEFINCQSANVPYFINEMALFPTALTDAQCIALTQ